MSESTPIAPDVEAALLYALWFTQGGSSVVGQQIRTILGMGQHDCMTDAQLEKAKSFHKGTEARFYVERAKTWLWRGLHSEALTPNYRGYMVDAHVDLLEAAALLKPPEAPVVKPPLDTKAVSESSETLEHVHIFTDKLALVTGDPADLPDSVPDDDPRRHNCDQMGCPSLDHVLYRLPFTDHRKPVDIKALARQLAESIDFTAGPVQARAAFEKKLATAPVQGKSTTSGTDTFCPTDGKNGIPPVATTLPECGKTDPNWGTPCWLLEGHEGSCAGGPF